MLPKGHVVFKGLTILAWVIFVGLCVDAGGLIVNCVVSVFAPDSVQYLYQKLDLTEVYGHSKLTFMIIYTFILAIAFFKSYLFYVVIQLLSKLDLQNPFNVRVSKQILLISYLTFAIGIGSYSAKQIVQLISSYEQTVQALDQFWVDSQAFIMMAAVIYVVATIFNHGVQLQHENDLTV